MKNVFEYSSYKSYLKAQLGSEGQRTGRRAAAAQAMGCQSAYLSQVLNGSAQLSLEQAFKLSVFLGLEEDEKKMWLLLVQKERAGTPELEDYFRAQIEDLLNQRQLIKNRLKIEENLAPQDQATYYSQWYYACIHVMLSIAHLQTKQAISDYLGLPLSTVSEVLNFFESKGLALREGDRFKIGPRHTHLSHESPHISRHHSNWRLQAMQSLDRPLQKDLHYSVVVTLSESDVNKIKDRLVQVIQENMKTIESSPEEVVYVQTIDFFRMGKP